MYTVCIYTNDQALIDKAWAWINSKIILQTLLPKGILSTNFIALNLFISETCAFIQTKGYISSAVEGLPRLALSEIHDQYFLNSPSL